MEIYLSYLIEKPLWNVHIVVIIIVSMWHARFQYKITGSLRLRENQGKVFSLRENLETQGILSDFAWPQGKLREICVLLSSVYRSRNDYNGKFSKIVLVELSIFIVYSVSVLLLSSSILLD